MKQAVLITGALGGIGKALCETFDQAGYLVIATDIGENSIEYTNYLSLDLNSLPACDATKSIFAEKVREILRQNSAKLNGIVNNAAIQILANTEKLTYSDWSKTLNVNLLAPYFLSKMFLSDLSKNSGVIVNISSIHDKLTKSGFTAYATSKAALTTLTKSMALELSEKVRVNAICPAAIETKMLKAGFDGREQEFSLLNEAHPTKKIGLPKEVAELALYLVDTAPAFMTGSCIELNGGIGARLHDPV